MSASAGYEPSEERDGAEPAGDLGRLALTVGTRPGPDLDKIRRMSALDPFHPAVQSWFAARLGEPTAPQRDGWPLIRAGRPVDVDAVEALREHSLRHVTITFAEHADPQPFAALGGVQVEHADGRQLRLSAAESAMDGVVKTAARHELVDLVSEPADLEEIFLDFYRDQRDGR